MSKHILIVEDTPDLLAGIQEVLSMEGFVVSVASDGREGQSILLTTKPDLIVTDLRMPHVNGFELIAYIRQTLKSDVKILVYSAMPYPENEKIVLELGADHYLKKPSTLEALIEVVNKLTSHG